MKIVKIIEEHHILFRFQKALRAFWDEARKAFSVHWCAYTIGHLSPCGLRDARNGIDRFSAEYYLNTIERRSPCGHREARKGLGVH